MMEFHVERIDDTNVTINGTVFSISKFAQSFIPAFCCTVYNYQGADISEPYNIYNVNCMDKKQLYTALSRTTKFEYNHLNTSALNHVYEIRKQPNMEIVKSYFNSDYNNGKIYMIEFEKCDKVYIGSTTGELKTRLMQHLTNNKSPNYQYRTQKPHISLLVNASSKGKRELEKVEFEWKADYSEKLGDRLLNKLGIKVSRKEVKYQAQMATIDSGTEKLLQDKIQKIGKTLRIKDNVINKLLYYDGKVDGKRYKTKARYNKCSKEEALTKITKKQQQLVDELLQQIYPVTHMINIK